MFIERTIELKKLTLNPIHLAKPKGYSHLVKVTGGSCLYVAGQASFDKDGNVVGESDFCMQYEQTINNLRVVLENGGAQLTDIVQMTIYCTAINELHQHHRKCAKIYSECFGNYFPAVTVVEVKRLFLPSMLIEIDAVAAI